MRRVPVGAAPWETRKLAEERVGVASERTWRPRSPPSVPGGTPPMRVTPGRWSSTTVALVALYRTQAGTDAFQPNTRSCGVPARNACYADVDRSCCGRPADAQPSASAAAASAKSSTVGCAGGDLRRGRRAAGRGDGLRGRGFEAGAVSCGAEGSSRADAGGAGDGTQSVATIVDADPAASFALLLPVSRTNTTGAGSLRALPSLSRRAARSRTRATRSASPSLSAFAPAASASSASVVSSARTLTRKRRCPCRAYISNRTLKDL
uniref:Uncharacterized protein n=1 Tax=Setaria viridis TaxID=4556 RepID=A0A4U6ULN0_SETVI|nr:hypothetical protein SEVIR_5G275500v2 [Setaria viridis]